MSKLIELKGGSDEGYTPKGLFDFFDKEFHFDTDPATTKDNRLGLKNYFHIDNNGLNKNGDCNVFCNPPYSNVKEGVIKAYEEHLRDTNRVIAFLIPARCDTAGFHKYIVPYAEVRFLEGRISFVDINGNSGKTGQFPSILVIWGNKPNIIGVKKEDGRLGK